jgi:hypothetical protein
MGGQEGLRNKCILPLTRVKGVLVAFLTHWALLPATLNRGSTAHPLDPTSVPLLLLLFQAQESLLRLQTCALEPTLSQWAVGRQGSIREAQTRP